MLLLSLEIDTQLPTIECAAYHIALTMGTKHMNERESKCRCTCCLLLSPKIMPIERNIRYDIESHKYISFGQKKTGHNNQLQTQALQNQLHNRNGYKFRLDISLVSSLTELNTVAFKYIDGGDDDDSNPISKHCTEQFVVSTSPMKSIDSAYVNKSKSAENAFDEHAYVIVNSMKLPDCLAMRIDVYFSIRVANDWIQ